jgi:hypothetical protein
MKIKEIADMKMSSNRLVVPIVILLSFAALLMRSDIHAAESAPTKKKVVAQKIPLKTEEKKADIKIIAYYFHGTSRCVSCRKIEAYSDEAIKSGFTTELKDGVLEWRVVNVEEKENGHFVEDYKLYTKSLVLVEMKDGKQVKWKNLDKVWELLKDKDAFIKYVKYEVSIFLNDVPKDEKKDTKKKEKQ